MGLSVGVGEGKSVGRGVGIRVGLLVGTLVGLAGARVGRGVGLFVGNRVGSGVSRLEGAVVGTKEIIEGEKRSVYKTNCNNSSSQIPYGSFTLQNLHFLYVGYGVG